MKRGVASRAARAANRRRSRAGLRWVLLSSGALAAALPAALVLTATCLRMPRLDPQPSTRVLDRHGLRLAHVRNAARERAEPVGLSQLSPWLVPALLAAEDGRFFYHPGVDPIAMARAAWQALRWGELRSGASTLTQQLARTLFKRPRTVTGKWHEMALAVRLEWQFDKARLLELYLNRAYFGPAVRGVAAGARALFDKPASVLSLAEASTLVALLKGPSHYSPWRHPERLRRRRDWVIGRLVELNQVDPRTGALARSSPLTLHPGHTAPGAFHWVRAAAGGRFPGAQAPTQPGARRLLTTLDSAMQTEVEAALRALPQDRQGDSATAAAAIVLENESGAVRAYVGSPDYAATEWLGQVDGVLAQRSPGSALKPFLYALAFEALELGPASILSDTETHFSTPQGPYSPRNYDLRYRGPVRARAALATSLNVPAVAVLERVGVDRWLAQLQALGLGTLDRPAEHYGLSLALGSGEVRLLDLSAAYLALARDGVYVSPRFFAEAPRRQKRVMGSAAARQITDILADSEARKPAFGRGLSFDFPVAFKTGTSKGYRDSWVVGYSEHVTVGVWVGNFDGRPTRELSGAVGAGPLFGQVMRAAERHIDSFGGAHSTLRHLRDSPPARTRLCALSGMLPGPGCKHTFEERFWVGAVPAQTCPWHVLECAPGGCRSQLHLPARFAAFSLAPGGIGSPPYSAGAGAKQAAASAPCNDAMPSLPRPSRPCGGLLSPPDGASYVLDARVPPKQQQLLLSAALQPGVWVDYWVDGERVGRAQTPTAWPWPLRAGSHQVAAYVGTRAIGHAHIRVRAGWGSGRP